MHHVLITYCTLKSIYFAGIAFICDEGAIKWSNICSVRRGLITTTTQALDSQCVCWGVGGLCPCQMSILKSILLVCHGKFQIRIEEGWLTELVVFLIGHFIHYKTSMAYQKTLAIRDYLAFTLRSAITECIHKTMAIDRKTT